jgi:hypothetical protein
MGDVTVGIASAYRAGVCMEATVSLLLNGGVPLDRITVYVPNPEQAAAYRTAAPVGLRIEVAPHDPHDRSMPTEKHPARGLATARNLALDDQMAQNTGGWCWWFDDDVKDIRRHAGENRSCRIGDGLWWWMQRSTADAAAWGATLIGVLPSANAMTMSPTRTLGLSFCIGQTYASALTRAGAIRGWLTEKDDYERSINHHLRGGGCYRINDVAPISKVYEGAGGLQLSRTYDRSHAEARWLVERYPRLIRINPKRTLPPDKGRAEVLIVRQATNRKLPRPHQWPSA